MQARLEKWVEYVGESPWRFGSAVIAMIAVQTGLLLVVVLK